MPDEGNSHHPALLPGHFCKWHCCDRKFQTDAPRPSVPLRWLIIRSARGLFIWAEPGPGRFNWWCRLLQLQTIRDKFFSKKAFLLLLLLLLLLCLETYRGRNASLLKVSGRQTKYVLQLNDNRRLHSYLGSVRHPGNFQEEAEVEIYANHKRGLECQTSHAVSPPLIPPKCY